MSLKYDRPSDGLMRELAAVARRAAAFETAMTATTNSPPEALPALQLTEILTVLKCLPSGTAEGGRLQLETADSRLNEIRLEFFSLTEGEPDDPGLMRDVPLDDALSLLIAAVRTALSAANREGGTRETAPTPTIAVDRREAGSTLLVTVGEAKAAARALEALQATGKEFLDTSASRADTLLRRLNDARGLVKQAMVELQWQDLVTAWIRRLADAISKTPQLIRTAADFIDAATDIVGPFYDQWTELHADIEKIVRENLPAFTRNLRQVADRLDRPRRAETILFVDDEEPARAFASIALRNAYRKVETAESGMDALRVIATARFDILVSDVVMPDMGGLALAAEVRKAYPSISVLLVSGYAEQAIQREISNLGYDFLAKPYTLEQLNEAVSRTLAKPQTR